MDATSQFARRYKKDLSTETLRTKVARRKSVLQKENRHKLFEKGRQFGLADVIIQPSRERGLSQLQEKSEVCSQDKSSVKQKPSIDAATKRINERKEMLQRYKEEKELQKLREQREKAKKGVFKVGLYRPTAPGFLSLVPEAPVTVKSREKTAPPFSGTITRSKAKNLEEKAVIPAAPKNSMVSSTSRTLCSTQAGCKQMNRAKAVEKEKVMQTAVQTASNVRITRAAASSAARQALNTAAPAATAGNQPQRKTTNGGKQKKAVKPDSVEEIPSKPEVNKNAQVDPAMKSSAADSKPSASVELQWEQTSAGNKNTPRGRPRTRSFAPHNFVFQPLAGLASYTVTPMTPSRANAFLTPNTCWVFSDSTVNIFEKSSETKAQEPNLTGKTSADKDTHEQQTTTSPKGEKASKSDEKTSIERSNETIAVTDTTELEKKSDDIREQEHDVPYFRSILQSESEKLMAQCHQWDGKLELDIPEDAKDLIRTTTGQTRLLIAERFKQFEGLVNNCEFKRGEKETMCTDLDGFWDMVNLQIEDVNKKFDNLNKLQDNEWQPLDVPSKAVVKKMAVPKGVAKPQLGGAGRAAARNRLAAVKAAMRDKMKHDGTADGAHQEKPPEVEKVVFEAGFFRIESPVKTFPGLLSKTPYRSSQQPSAKLATPRSSSRALLPNIPSVLPNPENATAEQTTPVLKGFHPPQNLKVHPFPLGKTSTLEKLPGDDHSISVVAEEQCAVAGTVEGAKMLENSNSQFMVIDETEEMELSIAERPEQDVMCSLEKETSRKTQALQSEEPIIHAADISCSDLTSFGRSPFDTPMLDTEFPFTVVKSKVQELAEAEAFGDLIVFSPLSHSGEK
ncbi:DLGP5 protein, partial [Rhinopomastus cyanomelas]|nr:DLGP5 protein [Rhinopomastus cyanomelas]